MLSGGGGGGRGVWIYFSLLFLLLSCSLARENGDGAPPFCSDARRVSSDSPRELTRLIPSPSSSSRPL